MLPISPVSLVDPENNQVISWVNKIDHEVKLTPTDCTKIGRSNQPTCNSTFWIQQYLSTKKIGADWNPFGVDGLIGATVNNANWFTVIHFYENKRTQLPNFGAGWGGHLPWEMEEYIGILEGRGK